MIYIAAGIGVGVTIFIIGVIFMSMIISHAKLIDYLVCVTVIAIISLVLAILWPIFIIGGTAVILLDRWQETMGDRNND